MSRVSRTLLYCGLSTAMTCAVVVSAFEARPNFYSAAVYLSQSSACLMVLTNMFLVFTLVTGKVLQSLFFGRLRAIEVDHLYERAWYAVTESCLAMTIFREEFDTTFFLFFTLLLSIKIFHWLAQDRIEYMEQTVQVARSFHIRMTSIMAILIAVDIYLVASCLEKVILRGPNVMIMFAFEFTILAASILTVIGKYVLNLIEARQTETWDNKSGYVFYLELVADFIKLVTYVAFFATLMTFYGIPLHILRDLYVTFRSFTSKCRNFMRFRRATQDMDARYRNATLAEIDATGDKTCIVCREEMFHESLPMLEGEPVRTILDNPKRLPCGHILHFRCLRSWLERQQTCPMCRRSVLEEPTSPGTNASRDNANTGAQNPPANGHNRLGVPQDGLNNHGAAIQANNATFQMPNSQGQDPVQLPRGFRLPPGWALIPVSTPDVPTLVPTLGQPVTSESSNPNDQETTSSSDGIEGFHNRIESSLSRNLPPVIPLFERLAPDVRGPITLPVELSVDQIRAMEQSTRRTVEERLRVLAELQGRITESVSMLTRLQNINPPTVPDTRPHERHTERAQSRAVEPSHRTSLIDDSSLIGESQPMSNDGSLSESAAETHAEGSERPLVAEDRPVEQDSISGV